MIGDIKHIVIIESLKKGEKLTGHELYHDCIRRRIDFQNKPFTHKYYSISSKHQLSELLKFYQINAPYLRGGLLLHFEMHGSEIMDGLVLSNNSLVEWAELVDQFRPINIATCNELFVTMATCYGRYLYEGIVDPYQKSPYSGYVSANKAVNPIDIIDKFTILFESLINKGNLVEAYQEMEEADSHFYYKDLKTNAMEAFQSVYNRFAGDAELKAKLIEEAKQMDEQIHLDNNSSELIFQEVFSDMFRKHIQAFDFSDCM